jgi:hypothetical protein
MRMPDYLPIARLTPARNTSNGEGGVALQGCNAWDWIKCGAVVAGCAGLSGPALVACVAAAAPSCIKCVT